jgi:HlyD family secretion protein
MNKTFKFAAFVLMLAIFIWGGYKLFVQEEVKEETEVIKAEKKTGDGSPQDEVKEAALPVTVLRIKRGDLPLRLPISATAEVWEKATLRAEVGGIVEKINYSIGDRVKKGEELLKLDDSEINLEVGRAEAAQLQALSQYLTAETLGTGEENEISDKDKEKIQALTKKYQSALEDHKEGKISDKQMDEINSEYQEEMVYSGAMREEIRKAQEGLADANIRLKQAKLDLIRTSIKAPFPCTIADIIISKGERVTAAQELVKIVNLQSIYLKGFALESEVKHLKTGIAVRIKFDSFPDKFFYGRIKSISPEIDPENKTISIYVDVDNSNNQILPGMHAELDVEYKTFKNVLKVPRNAIVVRNRPLIFIVDEKEEMALWEYVELGEKNDEDQIILKGLNNGVKEGDLVVISGNMTLAHQSKVKILEIIDQK